MLILLTRWEHLLICLHLGSSCFLDQADAHLLAAEKIEIFFILIVFADVVILITQNGFLEGGAFCSSLDMLDSCFFQGWLQLSAWCFLSRSLTKPSLLFFLGVFSGTRLFLSQTQRDAEE